METMMFNGRDTLRHYGLLLLRCTLSAAKRKQKWLNIPGVDGEMELLSGAGLIAYENRTLRAEFVRTAGTVGDIIDQLTSELEGKTVRITLPNSGMRFVEGVVHVAAADNSGSHVVITANCLPWRFAGSLRRIRFGGSTEPTEQHWRNFGDKPVVPELTVAEGGAVLMLDGEAVELAAGTHSLPQLVITGQSTIHFTLSGAAVTAEFREAIL